MKKTITLFLSIAIIVIGLSAQTIKDTTAKKHSAPVATKYTCPMHKEVIMDKPGVCPKCGMDLVPVKKVAAKKMMM